MIEQTRAEVWEESDPLEKAELATNDYVPFQG
jgi:hypothetical protein